MSGNYQAELEKNINENTFPEESKYKFYYLKAVTFPFQGLSDLHLNLLSTTQTDFNQKHSNETLIPPLNRLDVILQRDMTMDQRHLLQPKNITAQQLSKPALTEAEFQKFLSFEHFLPTDDDTATKRL